MAGDRVLSSSSSTSPGVGDLGLLGGSLLVDPSLDPSLVASLDPKKLPPPDPCLRNSTGSDTPPIKSSGEPIFTCRVNPLPNLQLL